MPRYLSSYPGDDGGTHLYPEASVDSATPTDPNRNRYRIVGPAYCGHESPTTGKKRVVFDPRFSPYGEDDYTEDHLKKRTRVDYWSHPCSECVDIQTSGKLQDAAWQRAYRSEHSEVFD